MKRIQDTKIRTVTHEVLGKQEILPEWEQQVVFIL